MSKDVGKNKAAVMLGKRGGKARALKLSKEQRVAIAKQGYAASPISRPGMKESNLAELLEAKRACEKSIVNPENSSCA